MFTEFMLLHFYHLRISIHISRKIRDNFATEAGWGKGERVSKQTAWRR